MKTQEELESIILTLVGLTDSLSVGEALYALHIAAIRVAQAEIGILTEMLNSKNTIH